MLNLGSVYERMMKSAAPTAASAMPMPGVPAAMPLQMPAAPVMMPLPMTTR